MVKKKGKKVKQVKNYSVPELLEKAEECLESYQFELAEKFYTRALELDPQNCDIMDTLGELLVDLGKVDKAKSLFEKSIATTPSEPAKYMNIGQLCDGEEALSYFRKGIELMLKMRTPLLGKKSKATALAELDEQLSAACCAVAEVYLTDSCFNDEAESECQKALNMALEYTPKGPEVHYLLSSLRISQQQNSEALAALNQGYSFWKDNTDEPDLDSVPYQLRFNYAKLFVELEQFQSGIEILEVLVAEEDNIAEVWHTLGLAYKGANDLHATHECLTTALQLFKQSGEVEQDVIESVQSLLEKTTTSINSLPEDADEAMEQDNEDDDDDSDE